MLPLLLPDGSQHIRVDFCFLLIDVHAVVLLHSYKLVSGSDMRRTDAEIHACGGHRPNSPP
jgi:hypothetical protein